MVTPVLLCRTIIQLANRKLVVKKEGEGRKGGGGGEAEGEGADWPNWIQGWHSVLDSVWRGQRRKEKRETEAVCAVFLR